KEDAFVNSVCFSPDGNHLASAAADSTVKVWDLEKGQGLAGAPLSLRGHAGPVWGICYSPDGKRMASTGDDGTVRADANATVRVWDARTGKEILSFRGGGTGICFSPDGTRLAGGSPDLTVKVWDAETGRQIQSFKGHTNSVRSVCFIPAQQKDSRP